jgi:DNA-binding NarL/FixJ family response regulator
MIRTLIADDQPIVRGGLRTILEAQDDIEVVAEAAHGAEAVELARTRKPDVVLMDIRMPVLDGIQATRRLLDSGAASRVLILTTYGLDEYVYEALKAGASGFLLKTESPERLVDAVRTIAAGDALLAPEITRRLIDRFLTAPAPSPGPPPALADLTSRELELLKHLAQGLSNAEIAQTLYISEGTVKTHVARILFKLELRDRVQAVVFAYECGLVRPGTAKTPPTAP